MQTEKFSISRVEAQPHTPEAQIHFLKFVPKVLSIPDAVALVAELVLAINEDKAVHKAVEEIIPEGRERYTVTDKAAARK